MFARTTSLLIKPDKIEEAIQLYDTSVIPAARDQKGFKMAYLLIDREARKGMSITFWESEDDAKANEENLYYQDQLAKFLTIFAADPVRDGFEVAVEAR